MWEWIWIGWKKKICCLWQWHCRNRGEILKKVRIILFFQYFFLLKQFSLSRSSMTKKSGMELWQWHCWNRREKNLFQLVCGNAIAEIEGKKKKNLWEWICGNGITEIGWKKILLQLVCGNGIAEIEERQQKVHIFLFFQYFFFTEIIWFVTFFYGKIIYETDPISSTLILHAVKKNKKKYVDSKQIWIDSSTLILILKCTL